MDIFLQCRYPSIDVMKIVVCIYKIYGDADCGLSSFAAFSKARGITPHVRISQGALTNKPDIIIGEFTMPKTHWVIM